MARGGGGGGGRTQGTHGPTPPPMGLPPPPHIPHPPHLPGRKSLDRTRSIVTSLERRPREMMRATLPRRTVMVPKPSYPIKYTAHHRRAESLGAHDAGGDFIAEVGAPRELIPSRSVIIGFPSNPRHGVESTFREHRGAGARARHPGGARAIHADMFTAVGIALHHAVNGAPDVAVDSSMSRATNAGWRIGFMVGNRTGDASRASRGYHDHGASPDPCLDRRAGGRRTASRKSG